jgi:hypothetical protein
MPLPTGDIQWPPPACRAANRLYDKAGAWYSGDPDRLQAVYAPAGGAPGLDLKDYGRPSQYRGGIVGRVARWFWGSPTPRNQLRDTRLHVPIAGDIAATSADLLFSEPPALVVDDGTTQDRLDELMIEAGVYATLLEGAELAAAYGDVYLRVTWDPSLADHPLPDALPGDVAVPEFQSGILRAVTFWRVVHEEHGQVWRHLERHEPGRILHGLYKGTEDRLGRPMPLQEMPDTEPFAAQVNADGAILTETKVLTAQHIPNMRPNRLLRGSPLGRSDFSPGVMRMMDALDETYSSWMRDIRLAKARLIVPDSYLDTQGRGQGATFDLDREVYEAVRNMGDDAGRLDISAHQFAIRVAEHSGTAQDLTARIVRGAGYSMQTFGETGDVAATATEVVARERRSYTTRSRKITYFRPGLGRFIEAYLAIDAAFFRSGVTPQRPTIDWPDGVAVDPKALAETLEVLNRAEAASTEVRVRMLHPDWDDPEIAAEVQRIMDEKSLGEVQDPDAFRGLRPGETDDPADMPDEDAPDEV